MFFGCLGVALSFSARSGEAIIPIRDKLKKIDFELGYCTKKTGESIDLESVFFLKNTFIKDGIERKKYTITEEIFYVERYDKQGSLEGKTFIPVDMLAAEYLGESKNLDVSLSLVLVNNKIGVFWKETFLYQIRHQGLFIIENDELVPVCKGQSGVTKSH